MRRHLTPKSLVALSVLVPTLIVGISGEALSQQRPLSISDWLKAEQNNANMQRAVEEYERAHFNSVPQQQQRYQQPASPQRQQQAQTPSPQAPRQWTAPGNQQPQPDPLSGGELPQRDAEQNTYQVPDDALEKIDKDIENREENSNEPSIGYLISASLGLAGVPQQSYTDSSSVGGADFSFPAFYTSSSLGYKFGNGLSFELEGAYQSAEYEETNITGDVTVLSLLANARFEFKLFSHTTSYLIGGIGTAYHNITDTELRNSSSNLDGDDFVMAYQFGSGALFPLNNKTSVDFGYRFFGTSDADISSNNDNFTAGYSSHIWKIGITHQL